VSALEIKYKQEQINQALTIINSIEVKGIINMQKLVALVNILNTPINDKQKEGVKNAK